MKPTPIITRHAIERYQQRVDPRTSMRDAAIAISRILECATARSRPRRWTRVVATAPGTRYLYAADWPGVCLVVAGGAVVTVHSRPVCAVWRSIAAARDQTRSPRPLRRDERLAGWEVDAA